MLERGVGAPTTAVLAPTTRRRTRRWSAAGLGWLWVSAAAIAVFAVVPYLTDSLANLGRDDNEFAQNYSEQASWVQTAFYLHIVFGAIALLLSPAQLSAKMRRRAPRLHRATGRIVLASIMIAGPAGAVLAPINLAGWIGTAGFGALAVLWVSCAFLAYRTIRRGDVRRHRQWAVRTFALTYAAVMLRLWLGVLLTTQIAVGGVEEGLAFDRAYHVVPFLCWVPNLLIAEYFIRRKQAGAASLPQTSRPRAARVG